MRYMTLSLVVLLGQVGLVPAQALPFEGYGKDATGGALRPVCTVTSGAAREPGTWDDCATRGGNQIIQFAVPSVTVAEPSSHLDSNTTIDGCANGQNGVTLNLPAEPSRGVILEGPVSNVIVRCMRFQGSGPCRPGTSSRKTISWRSMVTTAW